SPSIGANKHQVIESISRPRQADHCIHTGVGAGTQHRTNHAAFAVSGRGNLRTGKLARDTAGSLSHDSPVIESFEDPNLRFVERFEIRAAVAKAGDPASSKLLRKLQKNIGFSGPHAAFGVIAIKVGGARSRDQNDAPYGGRRVTGHKRGGNPLSINFKVD